MTSTILHLSGSITIVYAMFCFSLKFSVFNNSIPNTIKSIKRGEM